MKKRTILPIAGLVVLSGIAAISGTFAWFQTSRTALITFNDATVRAKGSNLVVDYKGSLNNLDPTSTGTGIVEPFGGHAEIDLKIDKANSDDAQFITDISGNGVNFYKPNWGHVINPNTDKLDGVSNYKAHSITTLPTAQVGDADGYYIDFSVELSRALINNAVPADLQVHLGASTGIFPLDGTEDADLAAVAASRMAITNTTQGALATDDILFIPVAEPLDYNRNTGPYTMTGPKFDNDPLYTHLVENVGKSAYGLSDFEIVEYAGKKQVGAFIDVPVYEPGKTNLENGYLVTLTDAAPSVSLNFRVWIEGTDSDAGEFDYAAIAGQISVVVELYALEVA